jgi:inorganic pyrophosphatase
MARPVDGTSSSVAGIRRSASFDHDDDTRHGGDRTVGERVRMDVTVIVEIPRGQRTKFEIDPATGTVWLDRVLSTATRYPAEYGFIVGTAGGDGDPLDAVLLVEEQTVPGCHVRARPIGLLGMVDEKGSDPKVLCVAVGDPSVGEYHDISDVNRHRVEEIEHFFRVYKELEPDKPVAVEGWHGAAAAEQVIDDCRRRAIQLERKRGDRMKLDLDDSRTELLREILDSTYRDLKYEIADTDNSTFRSQLVERRRLIESLLDDVGGPLPDRR